MGYVVHDANIVLGIFPDQQSAQDYTAQSGGSIRNIPAIPAWAEPGCYISDTGALALDPPATDIQYLKRVARAACRKLNEWQETLPEYAHTHSTEHIDLAENFHTYAHEGLYLITVSSAYTTTQKISLCSVLPQGPADITSPLEFLEHIPPLTDAQKPTGPCVWLTPPTQDSDAWTRVNLSEAVGTSAGIAALSGTVPDGILNTDVWIDTLST